MTQPGETRGRSLEVLAVAAAVAMLSVIWFVARVFWIRSFGIAFAGVSREFLWMAPLSHLLIFILASLPLALIAPRLSLSLTRRLTVGWMTCVAVFAILLPFAEIARWSAIILSLGTGVAASRWKGAVSASLAPRACRIFAISFLLITGTGLVDLSVRIFRHHLAVQQLAPVSPAAPSVLLIILDTVRAASLGLYGYERNTTPQLAAFARTGVLFTDPIASAPWTLPSISSIFTGHYAGSWSGDFTQPFDDSAPTIAECLRSRGYETAAFTANFHYTTWESGLSRGFLLYRDHKKSLEQVIKTSLIGQSNLVDALFRSTAPWEVRRALRLKSLMVRKLPVGAPKSAAEVTDEFLSWFKTRDPARPYFAFLNYMDAHEPYLPPARFRTMFASEPLARDRYDGAIAYIDQELGRLFQRLESTGALSNTLVVVTADHGEQFREHGLVDHANSLYRTLLSVPLIMRFEARLVPATRYTQPVSLRDIAATVTDATGTSGCRIPGQSILATLRDSSVSGSDAIAWVRLYPEGSRANREMYSILDGQWHYIRKEWSGAEELYAYRDDPREMTNRIGTEEGKREALRLQTRMAQALRADSAHLR